MADLEPGQVEFTEYALVGERIRRAEYLWRPIGLVRAPLNEAVATKQSKPCTGCRAARSYGDEAFRPASTRQIQADLLAPLPWRLAFPLPVGRHESLWFLKVEPLTVKR